MVQEIIFSVIFLSKNSESTVENAIHSLISQKKNAEIIVLDGGSTDSTIQILNKYSNFFDYFSSELDGGPVEAINKGWKLCKGKYIVILSSDDILEKGYFDSLQSAVFDNVDVISTSLSLVEDGEVLREFSCNDLDFSYHKILKAPLSNARIILRDIYKTVGGYNENYKFCADLDFLIKVSLLKNIRCVTANGAKYLFHVHENSRTQGRHNLNNIYHEELRIFSKYLKSNFKFILFYLIIRTLKNIFILKIKIFFNRYFF